MMGPDVSTYQYFSIAIVWFGVGVVLTNVAWAAAQMFLR
jgi:hypothetical protein